MAIRHLALLVDFKFATSSGSVHSPANFSINNPGRKNYTINMNFGVKKYIVNPLINEDQEVDPINVAAFINKPSPPVWKKGDIVCYAKRNVLVTAYDNGEYNVEHASGLREFVHPSDIDPHPLKPLDDKVCVANCLWYDFPVPLIDLYRPTKRRHGNNIVYSRTKKATCVIAWSKSNISAAFDAFDAYSDTLQLYKVSKETTPEKGNVIILNEDVFMGLERTGLVLEVSTLAIRVQHSVCENMIWRLPHKIQAAKQRLCPECTVNNNPKCQKCVVVLFPLVHACRPIQPGEEFLCLYSYSVKQRGLMCKDMLDNESMRPPWDEFTSSLFADE